MIYIKKHIKTCYIYIETMHIHCLKKFSKSTNITKKKSIKKRKEKNYYFNFIKIYEDKNKNKILLDDSNNAFIHYKNNDKYYGNFEDNEKNGQGKLYYQNGNIYEGEFKDGKRNGNGKYYYNNGDCYEGEWKNNVKNGKGIYKYFDGNIYEGEFVNNKKNGKGKYISFNGDIYEGIWENDFLISTKIKFKNGNIYEGEFASEEIFVKGKMIYKNGNIYEGEFQNNEENGNGKFIFKDIGIYRGEFRNGKICGNGKIIYFNGESYEGEWKNGFKYGQGIYKYINGDAYKGEWKNDMKNGYGLIIYSNGDAYKGEWKNNVKYGKGKMKYFNGCIYDGNWINNLKHGNGILKYQNSFFEGTFTYDKCQYGNGIFTDCINPNIQYIGKIVNYMYDGPGTLIIENKKISGNFVNNKIQGFCEMIENDTIYKGFASDNQKNGLGTLISNNKLIKGIWKNEKLIFEFKNNGVNNEYDFIGDYDINVTCNICFEKHKIDNVYYLCNNDKCNKFLCTDCIIAYKDRKKIKSGRYIKKDDFSCMFCRNLIDKNILDFIFDYEFGDDFYNIEDKILGLCKICNQINEVKKIECNANVNNNFICEKCSSMDYIHIKNCPNCNIRIGRKDNASDGCNVMLCSNCNTSWCWLCLNIGMGYGCGCVMNNDLNYALEDYNNGDFL
jgi:hypothetical protein